MALSDWFSCLFWSISTRILFLPCLSWFEVGWGDGLPLNKQQAITWTSVRQVPWCHHCWWWRYMHAVFIKTGSGRRQFPSQRAINAEQFSMSLCLQDTRENGGLTDIIDLTRATSYHYDNDNHTITHMTRTGRSYTIVIYLESGLPRNNDIYWSSYFSQLYNQSLSLSFNCGETCQNQRCRN